MDNRGKNVVTLLNTETGAMHRCFWNEHQKTATDAEITTILTEKGLPVSKYLLFFATKKDMIDIFDSFCELLPFEIKYVYTEMSCDIPDVFYSIEDIPHIGYLHSRSHCSENYIILKKDVPIEINKIISCDNDVLYSIFSSENITSMSFSPSGLNIDGDCLIHGQFTIMNENDITKEMMKMIKKALKNNCKLVRGWYVGHEAEQLNGKVRYITVGVNEPQEYDFKL